MIEMCVKRSHGEPIKRRDIFEQAMYFSGSIVFMIGTIIWDPDLLKLLVTLGGTELEWKAAGCSIFMIGSFMFCLAAYFNALNLYESHLLFLNYAITITA